MFAAVAGVLAVAGLASAQSPAPNYLPQIPTAPIPAHHGGVIPASGSTGARAAGGVVHQPAVPYGQYGQGCNNGCGNWKSDAGFIFGSCKSFFDPCGPQPCGTGRFFNKQKCPPHPFASPYGTGYNGCNYDSYLNH
jgi:hypothetical protein